MFGIRYALETDRTFWLSLDTPPQWSLRRPGIFTENLDTWNGEASFLITLRWHSRRKYL